MLNIIEIYEFYQISHRWRIKCFLSKAQISLDIYSVDETMDLTVCIVSNSWEEYEINYANKPDHVEIIGTWQAMGDKIYTMDVSDFIDESKEGISVCVYTAEPVDNANCQGHTREGAYS